MKTTLVPVQMRVIVQGPASYQTLVPVPDNVPDVQDYIDKYVEKNKELLKNEMKRLMPLEFDMHNKDKQEVHYFLSPDAYTLRAIVRD